MSKRLKAQAQFKAHVYEDDYRQIQELVQQYPKIETGGDLFGLWKDESTVVIQQFIGPGKNCRRTTSSFHQDIEYLGTVGSLITTEEGLCNVGEWHSHHQIGMPYPSAADRRTVFSNMPQLGLERFVLFIATIERKGSGGKRSHDVKLDDIDLHPFLFLRSKKEVVKGDMKIIPGKNPHRFDSRAETEIEDGKELPKKKEGEGSGPPKQGKNKGDRGDENKSPNPSLATAKGRGFSTNTESFSHAHPSYDPSSRRPQQKTSQKPNRGQEQRTKDTIQATPAHHYAAEGFF